MNNETMTTPCIVDETIRIVPLLDNRCRNNIACGFHDWPLDGSKYVDLGMVIFILQILGTCTYST